MYDFARGVGKRKEVNKKGIFSYLGEETSNLFDFSKWDIYVELSLSYVNSHPSGRKKKKKQILHNRSMMYLHLFLFSDD